MKLSLTKKFISIATAVITIFSGVVPAFAASELDSTTLVSDTVSQSEAVTSTFNDTGSHWGQTAIKKWNGYGVVKGYNGTFRPDAPVTRAEFSTMIDNIMKYIDQGNNGFTDLSAEQWYYNAILKLNTAGVLKGTDGKALPENKITRQEAAVLIAGAFKIGNGESSTTFSDNDQIASWAKGAVLGLVSKAVISGMPDGSFRPTANLTRAEAVTLFDNLIQTLISQPGEYTQDVSGNVVINTSGAVLKNMKITGDLYIAQGVGEGEVTLDNVVITGSVHVQGGGVNSIIFNNVDVKGALVVNKYNGQVRVLATGSTSVSVTMLESGAMLVTKELTGGGFETVEISADILAGQEIKLDGNFTKVVNRSSEVKITASGTIKELAAEANTTITGDVKVEKVTEASGVSATVNGAAIQTGSTSTNVTTGGSTGGGAGGGSTGGGSSDGGAQTVAVTGLSLSSNAFTLWVGESKKLEATVSPANATNKNVVWKVAEDSAALLDVTAEGLITAKAVGTGTVTATTADGGFIAKVIVTINQSSLGVKLSKFEGDVLDAAAQVEEAVKTNSANVEIKEASKSLIQENHYDAAITAKDALQKATVSYDVYTVITLTDNNGQPVLDTSSVEVTVNGLPYNAAFGEDLAEGYKAGSFVFKLDVEQPEKIEQYQLVFRQEGYADTSMKVTYRPVGTVSLQEIGSIVGEPVIGTELTAGLLKYDGVPANENVVYQWYQADTENGLYTAISGANNSLYELTPAEGGKYIRVGASADEIEISGAVLSPAFGPVEKPVNVDDVFKAIEASYLGKNVSLNNIISNLTLPTSLEAYPGVKIDWSSNNEQAITSTGTVTRGEKDDQFVTLTVTLSGKASGKRSYEMIVRTIGTENIDTEGYIDSYFTTGYPQAYVKGGTIHVRYALNSPAEVYMVVNVGNGRWESDVKAVLEGHAGKNNDVIYVDKWPYFELNESQVNEVQDFDTGVTLADRNSGEARVEFVIVDKTKNYTSANVTTVRFDQAVVGALDIYPPNSYTKYINNALDTIYIFYNEKINANAVPLTGDFVLSTGKVEAISIYNYDKDWGMTPSYVKLTVSGITTADLKELKVSYNGNAIEDLSDARNKALTYKNAGVLSIDEGFKRVTISSDRKSIIAELEPGWNSMDNMDQDLNASVGSRSRFNIEIAGHGSFSPSSATYSYSTTDLEYTLKFETPLPEGAAVLKFNTSGIVNWAKDLYPAELVSESVQQIPDPGTPTAVYSSSKGTISLTFADGFEFNYASLAAGMVLKVDGVEYALRGFTVSKIGKFVDGVYIRTGLEIMLSDQFTQKIKNVVESGTDVQIKYTKVNGDDSNQLSDAAGALLPDFDYVQVVK